MDEPIDMAAELGLAEGPSKSLVRRDGDCVLWTGRTNRAGYAIVMSSARHVSLARLVFEVTQRPLLPGEVVRHVDSCRQRNCIAPAHLTAGSQADNMADMKRRREAGLPSSATVRERDFRARRRAAIASSIPHVPTE